MDETPFPYQKKQNKGISVAIIVAIGMIVLGAALLGMYISQPPKKTEVKQETITPTSAPSPTEQPKIEKTAVKIQVLNGTGTPGEAGLVVKSLIEAGYSTDNIKSANADTADHTTATITARANFDSIVSDIKDILKSTFDEITVESPDLKEDNAFDVVIVTGGKLYEEPTSAPTASSASSSGNITPSPTP